MLEELGLGSADRGDEGERRRRLGLERHRELHRRARSAASREAIQARGITVLDVIRALDAARLPRGGGEPALRSCKLRLSGDYLQTSALVRDGRVLSRGQRSQRLCRARHRLPRRAEARRAGDQRASATCSTSERCCARRRCSRRSRRGASRYRGIGRGGGRQRPARGGDRRLARPSGSKLFRTLAGHPASPNAQGAGRGHPRAAAACRASCGMRHTADTSFLGLSAARLSGSGVGIGIQAKGTAVIHQADRLPHHNLELFSNAPITTPRALPPPRRQRRRLRPRRGAGAGGGADRAARRWARAIHAEVALIYAIETALTVDGAAPEEIAVDLRGGRGMSAKLTVADYPARRDAAGARAGAAASRCGDHPRRRAGGRGDHGRPPDHARARCGAGGDRPRRRPADAGRAISSAAAELVAVPQEFVMRGLRPAAARPRQGQGGAARCRARRSATTYGAATHGRLRRGGGRGLRAARPVHASASEAPWAGRPPAARSTTTARRSRDDPVIDPAATALLVIDVQNIYVERPDRDDAERRRSGGATTPGRRSTSA